MVVCNLPPAQLWGQNPLAKVVIIHHSLPCI